MSKYVFAYRVPQDYVPGPETMQDWQGWLGSLGENLTDFGQAVIQTGAVGEVTDGTRLAGYSVITADSLEDAITLAKGCPALQAGGGVEVGAAMDTDAS
jgi:hypothetical protein